MKTQTVTIALATVLFMAAAFADHNRTDEQGRKQGHWTEFPNVDVLLASEGTYVDDKRHGKWVLRWADGDVWETSYVDGKEHGKKISWLQGVVVETPYVNDKKHGKEIVRYSNSDAIETCWENGNKIDC